MKMMARMMRMMMSSGEVEENDAGVMRMKATQSIYITRRRRASPDEDIKTGGAGRNKNVTAM